MSFQDEMEREREKEGMVGEGSSSSNKGLSDCMLAATYLKAIRIRISALAAPQHCYYYYY